MTELDAASPRPSPGEGLRTLLDSARRQDEAAAEEAALSRAVEALVPDEALVLARLAALGRVPLVQIWTRPHTGAAGEPVLENASRIGRLAQVALVDLTPTYVRRLIDLGLAQVEGVDAADSLGGALADHFQELLADPLVLRALARANVDGSTPRVVRQTLSLSPLGERLVAAAQVESSTAEP